MPFLRVLKRNQKQSASSRLEFGSPIPFPTTIIITPRAPINICVGDTPLKSTILCSCIFKQPFQYQLLKESTSRGVVSFKTGLVRFWLKLLQSRSAPCGKLGFTKLPTHLTKLLFIRTIRTRLRRKHTTLHNNKKQTSKETLKTNLLFVHFLVYPGVKRYVTLCILLPHSLDMDSRQIQL